METKVRISARPVYHFQPEANWMSDPSGCQGGYRQSLCIATGTDDLCTWQKYPGNPVIAGPPSPCEAR
jgi:sucrose-6-phosphate hydrolase SacC (GH32 family)